jgi:transcriptional regulator with XRE-family HTH domain
MRPTLTEISQNGLVTPQRIKQFRKRRGWSARILARELGGYTRSYIKSLEGGSLPVSAKFARAFCELEANSPSSPHTVPPTPPTIRSKYKLPPGDVLLLARARKCPGCKRNVILPYANQKYCDAACRARALSADKSKRKGVKK